MLTGTVAKPHPKGSFHARRGVRADKGGSLCSAGITGVVLGWFVLSVGVLPELGKGSGTHFPASQVPFPPAVLFQVAVQPNLGECVGECFRASPHPSSLDRG